MRRVSTALVALTAAAALVLVAAPAWAGRDDGRSFDVSPNTVKQGGSIRFKGTARRCKYGDPVRIELRGARSGALYKTWEFSANKKRGFNRLRKVPKNIPVGSYKVVAYCNDRLVGRDFLKVRKYPWKKSDALNVSHNMARAGDTITLTGDECPTRKPAASFDGRPLALNVDRRAKDAGFTATAEIPREAIPGKHQLKAGCDAGSAGTTELQVLDADNTQTAAARRAFEPEPSTNLAVWAGLFAGIALLVASLGITRRRRS